MSAPDITESDIQRALGDFVSDVCPGLAVEVAQLNKLPEVRAGDFVLMTPSNRVRLATNVNTWDELDPDPTNIAHLMATMVIYQFDVHGPNSGDNAQVIAQLFRDAYACDFLEPYDVQPLYADDPAQLPFVNGENQYEDRWVFNVHLQANISVSTAQGFANKLGPVGIVEVDAVYPP